MESLWEEREKLAAKGGTAAERRSLGWLMLDAGAIEEAVSVARGFDLTPAGWETVNKVTAGDRINRFNTNTGAAVVAVEAQ